ncbi:lipooligosaccharide transport system permease protein [Branchiibius hedensis]|uniref:Transport permease protein n=1 Tax=Branchiibius hedensis TaxID=672460 RepID=A0A2Y8ZTM0_9MICO|nr:ABC transporter permease [Branchiibius hedensis]PWJ24792.1 lipooligosaccharide transport system permease protein [Branchiibius hedensis]SSA33609.1 lipooligosaccharide transport system permease protein [Branchiibius hedensis]
MSTVPAASPWALTARLTDYWLTVLRRTWRGSIVTSFLNPLLYVAAMGVFLGGFIKSDPATLDGASSYLDFVVPGLLAAQSMQLAIGEATYPVMGAIKWDKTYFSMLASPIGVGEIVAAHFSFIMLRIAISSAVFVLVMAPFGVISSVAGGFAAFAVQLLISWAFVAPMYAVSCLLKNESGFSLIFRLVVMPLVLFSGAFFPIHNLPTALEHLAKISPLWQGVELTRMATLDTWRPSAWWHLLYLLVVAVAFTVLSVRFLRRRLVR